MITLRITRSVNPEQFNAWLGTRRLCRSRQPLLTAARILLAEGVSPDEVLGMCHGGNPAVALSGRIGRLAGLTVRETDDEGPYLVKLNTPPYRHARTAHALKSETGTPPHPTQNKRTGGRSSGVP